MKFTDSDLQKASQAGIISTEIYTNLIDFLKQNNKKKTSALELLFYYVGAILIILTMLFYFGIPWEHYGPIARIVISAGAFIVFTILGEILWKKGKETPGGLLFTAAICTIPLLVYTIEQACGVKDISSSYSSFHAWISSSWLYMELATIIVGLLFFKYRRFSFFLVPVLFCLWYLTMDISPLIAGMTSGPTWITRSYASLFCAGLLLPIGIRYNHIKNPDSSFWLLLCGALLLEGSLCPILRSYHISYLVVHIVIGIIGFVYMITSILLKRNLFMVLGAISCIDFVGYLALVTFGDSGWFPFVALGIGLLFIYAGIFYSKQKKEIADKITGFFLKN